jgi:hypothetical protein
MSKPRGHLAGHAITEVDLLRRMREAFSATDGVVRAGAEASGQELGMRLYLIPEAYWRAMELAENAGWVLWSWP